MQWVPRGVSDGRIGDHRIRTMQVFWATVQHEKAFAQSERARVGGLCEVSPPAVLVRRQPFIGPVGRGCRMGCQLHVNFLFIK